MSIALLLRTYGGYMTHLMVLRLVPDPKYLALQTWKLTFDI